MSTPEIAFVSNILTSDVSKSEKKIAASGGSFGETPAEGFTTSGGAPAEGYQHIANDMLMWLVGICKYGVQSTFDHDALEDAISGFKCRMAARKQEDFALSEIERLREENAELIDYVDDLKMIIRMLESKLNIEMSSQI